MDEPFTDRLVYSDSDDDDANINDDNPDDIDNPVAAKSTENIEKLHELRTKIQSDDSTSDIEGPPESTGMVKDVTGDSIDVIETNGVFNEKPDSSDDDDIGEVRKRSTGMKRIKILSSDEEDSYTNAIENNQKQGNNETNEITHKSDDDDDNSKHSDNETINTKTVKLRTNIWDSDSSASSKEEDKVDRHASFKSRKKINKTKSKERKQKVMKKREQTINSGSDSETEDSGRLSDKNEGASNKLKSLCDEESSVSSGSEGHQSSHGKQQQTQRDKSKQRMSAKAAEAQIKEIQSESQRMARELYINVPYHKPKQYSLKEFLSRRTLAKNQVQSMDQFTTKKTAAAIKMTDEELFIYDQKLKERAKEAIEFFQNENEEEPEMKDVFNDESRQTPTDGENDLLKSIHSEVQETEVLKRTEELEMTQSQNDVRQKSSMDEINILLSSENADGIGGGSSSDLTTNTNSMDLSAGVDKIENSEPNEKPSEYEVLIQPINQIELHTTKNELDFELDNLLLKSKAPLFDLNALNPPRLRGSEGMIIDLESNEVKPVEKSGADELLERFLKTTRKKIEPELEEICIFNKDTGTLEMQKIHHVPTECQGKEHKPGEAYFKLKNELTKKISEKRRENITKRLEEEKQKRKEMESDDDEQMEEYSDCGAENDENDCEALDEDIEDIDNANIDENEANKQQKTKNKFICDEAEDDDDDECSNEASSSRSDDSDGDSIGKNSQDGGVTEQRKSRILAAFEDSDEEVQPIAIEGGNAQNNAHKITILSDIVISQPLINIPSAKSSINNRDDSFLSATGDKCNSGLDDTSLTHNKTFESDDMQDFESRLFQVNTQSDSLISNAEKSNVVSTSNLFSQSNNDNEMGESQLMALCSGEFVTQNLIESSVPVTNEAALNTEIVEPTQTNDISAGNPGNLENNQKKIMVASEVSHSTGRLAILSSDEEEEEVEAKSNLQNKKRRERQKLTFSDDEDDQRKIETDAENSNEQQDEEVEDEELEDEEDPGEQYIDYDSDENEIEVKLAKTEVRKKASAYLENEAELSESDWDSADEDERNLDVFEHELGDEDEFDKAKLQSELERIRMREQIDQDAREIRIIKEMHLEEEEDGQNRERKFRWKHLDNSANFNDSTGVAGDTAFDLSQHESDDENEEQWRRLRYEREQLLMKQQNDSQTSTIEMSTETIEQNAITPKIISNTSIFHRTSMLKTTSPATHSSPFLINRSISSQQQHIVRKSFLNRDTKTLEKLANLTKFSGDSETIANTATHKGNYVFTTTAKKSILKRNSDTLKDDNDNDQDISNNKKQKLSVIQTGDKLKTTKQTKCIFELLN